MMSAASEISSPVGVIAGGGAMPFAVADSLQKRGIAPVLFALRGACDPVAVERFRHHWISVGQLGRAIKLFRSEGCRDLIFIGTLQRPALSEIRLDLGTIRRIGHIMSAFRGGDDHLLSGIGRILEQDGFRMVGIRDVAPDILMPEGDHRPRNARSGGHRRHRAGTRSASRARSLRHRPGRRRDRRPCGGGRGHRGHRRLAGARGAAAGGGPHPRQPRPGRAGEGAQERPGPALRPSDGRPQDRRRRGQRGPWPAWPSSPAIPLPRNRRK